MVSQVRRSKQTTEFLSNSYHLNVQRCSALVGIIYKAIYKRFRSEKSKNRNRSGSHSKSVHHIATPEAEKVYG